MDVSHSQPISLTLPRRSLLVLCGSAGSGKSTLARRLLADQQLPATCLVSSDACRALVCDDAGNQQFSREAFDLFYFLLGRRMLVNRFCLADSTALTLEARQRFLKLAQSYRYPIHLLILQTPLEVCRRYNQQRSRVVEDATIEKHARSLQLAIKQTPLEGWDSITLLAHPEQPLHLYLT